MLAAQSDSEVYDLKWKSYSWEEILKEAGKILAGYSLALLPLGLIGVAVGGISSILKHILKKFVEAMGNAKLSGELLGLAISLGLICAN